MKYLESASSADELVRGFLKTCFGKDILPDPETGSSLEKSKAFQFCTPSMSRFVELLYACLQTSSAPKLSSHLNWVASRCISDRTQYPLSLMIPLSLEDDPDDDRLDLAMALHKRLAVYHPGTTDCLLAGMDYVLCQEVLPVEHFVRKIIAQYRELCEHGFASGLETMFTAELSVFLHLHGQEPDMATCASLLDAIFPLEAETSRELFPLLVVNGVFDFPQGLVKEIASELDGIKNPVLGRKELWFFGLTALFLTNLPSRGKDELFFNGLLSTALIWVFSVLYPVRMKSRL